MQSAITSLEELAGLKIYDFQSAGQLSIEEFYVPFGGKLDPGNRWVVLANVFPWEPLENQYAPLFNAKTGAPAKPFRMALGALYIQQRLGVTDRETGWRPLERCNSPGPPRRLSQHGGRISGDWLRLVSEVVQFSMSVDRQGSDTPHPPHRGRHWRCRQRNCCSAPPGRPSEDCPGCTPSCRNDRWSRCPGVSEG
jgi:hypothetical protein